MAKAEGIVRFKGTLGGISFYKSKDGYIARSKGGPDKNKINKDPAFARTRENNKEFGSCVKCASVLRRAISPLGKPCSDHRVTSRLNAMMFAVKECDTLNARGERTVAAGISSAAGKNLLQTFEFNKHAHVATVLKKPVTINYVNGAMQINQLDATRDIAFPPGGTHVAFTSGWARINFMTGEKEFLTSNTVYVARQSGLVTVTLNFNAAPVLTGNDVFVLQLRFEQEIGGVYYELNNGEFNCLKVMGVM